MAKKKSYKAKNKAKKPVKNLPKNNPKNKARTKRPSKRKPSNGNNGVTVQVKGGSSPALVVLIVTAVLALMFLIVCLVYGYHVHWDKNKDHYCDVMNCNACMPVDEDGDGLCDICGGCTKGHSDKDKNCECDRCDKETHVDTDGDYHCDNCNEWMPKTNIGKGIKGTFESIGKNTKRLWNKAWNGTKRGFNKVGSWIKQGFNKAGTGIKQGFTDFGNWVESWWPGHVCIDKNGNGWCDKCPRRMPSIDSSGCIHVDANNNGICDICDAKLFAVDEPSDCLHVDLDDNGRCDKCNDYITGKVEGDNGGEDSGDDNTGDNGGENGGDDNTDKPTAGVVTITFNPNGGTLTGPATMQTDENGMLVELPSDPIYDDEEYMFVEWTYTQHPAGEFSDGDGVSFQHTAFTEDIEIYALWLKVPDDIPSGGEGEGDKDDGEGENDNEGDLPEGGGNGGNGNENPPPSGGDDNGNDNTGDDNTGGNSGVNPELPSVEEWTEDYYEIKSEEQADLPFEYCYGSDSFGRTGIKIRVIEGFLASEINPDNPWLVIPEYIDGNKVLQIDEGAFAGDYTLTGITIEGAVVIGKHAFKNCTSLQNVYLADGCRLYPSSFYGCTALVDIQLGNFAYVGDSVFYRSGIGSNRSATFDFSMSLTLEEFLGKYEENEWEHLLGREHGALYDLGKTEPVLFKFKDCEILYYSENEEEETLLKYLENL